MHAKATPLTPPCFTDDVVFFAFLALAFLFLMFLSGVHPAVKPLYLLSCGLLLDLDIYTPTVPLGECYSLG